MWQRSKEKKEISQRSASIGDFGKVVPRLDPKNMQTASLPKAWKPAGWLPLSLDPTFVR